MTADRGPAVSLNWYRDGLRFSCKPNCGNCCSGHGVVRVDIEEMDRLAAGLAMERADFARKYVRSVDHGYSLRDKGPHGDCVFLGDDRRCSVYDHRPTQCRTWPFWPANLTSRKAWASAAERCPGMEDGERHSEDRIEAVVSIHRKADESGN